MQGKELSVAAQWFAILSFGCAILSAESVFAQTVLVGPGVRNGDFEMDIKTDDQRPYSATAYWWNVGTGAESAAATRINLGYAGIRNYQGSEGAGSVGGHDTGHTIAAGDAFEVTYWWRDASGWDDLDQVVIRLYTTDTDSVDGTATDFATLLSGVSTQASTYEAVTNNAAATAAEAGKRLFAAIDTQSGGGAGVGYFRLDNFRIAVTSAPTEHVSIIDYDPATRNGGIDSGVGSTTTNWGTGLNVSTCTRSSNTNYVAPHGASNTLLVVDAGQWGIGGLQNTGYKVNTVDYFSLVFDWTSAFQWDAADSIVWRLFTTNDDTVGGDIRVIASGTVSGKTGDGTEWGTSDVLSAGGVVGDASRGRDLWLEIYGSASTDDEYAFVDMVHLSVVQRLGSMFKFR